MLSIKKYAGIVNKQFKVNKKRNLSTISGIILSIVLFTIVGYISIYYKEVEKNNTAQRSGKYEAVILDMKEEEIDKLNNNVLVDKVGLYSIFKELYNDNTGKSTTLYSLDNVMLKEFFDESIFIEEGRLPQNNKEIIIDEIGKIYFNKNIGDNISLYNNEYKVVGLYNKYNSQSLHSIDVITYLDDRNNVDKVNAAFTVKPEKNKGLVIENVILDLGIKHTGSGWSKGVEPNYSMYYEYGKTSRFMPDNYVNEVFRIENILYFVILVLTIIMTYSSINVSIKERISQFSILRCMGASTFKIKMLLIKESLILGIYSIIPGLIIGQLMCYFIIYNILNSLSSTKKYQIGYTISYEMVVVIVILSIISIVVSTLIPIVNIGKIEPIYGIKNNTNINKKIKKTNSLQIRKIFGYNAEIAYKNIMSNSKTFFITTTISIIMLTTFIVFSGIVDNMIKSKEELLSENPAITIEKAAKYESRFKDTLSQLKQREKELYELKIVSKVFGMIEYYMVGVFEDIQFNKIINYSDSSSEIGEVNTMINNKNVAYSDRINLYIMDDNSLEYLLKYVDNEELTLEDFKDNGVIIGKRMILKNFIQVSKSSLFDLKNGEKFTLAIKDSEYSGYDESLSKEVETILQRDKKVELKYLGDIDTNKIFGSYRYGNTENTTLVVSEDFYNNNNDLFINKNELPYLTSRNISISLDLEPDINRESAAKIVQNYANRSSAMYTDNTEINMEFKNNNIVTKKIINVVLIITCVIGGINMINNKIISIKLRSKEIGTLLSIGINKKRLRKILMLESIIQWAISCTISLSLSYIILNITYKILTYTTDIINSNMPIFEVIIGCSVLLLINILGTYLPIRKLKYTDTNELIRNDE